MAIIEKFFDSKEALNAELSTSLEAALTNGIETDGRATLLVSGGSSPAPAYKHLSALALPWHKIDVAMVDERWVDVEHEKSNETFIKQTLLQGHAKEANFVVMKNASQTAQVGVLECEAAYQTLKQPFDVTILGMGPDGHTASLFPEAGGLEHGLTTDQLVCAITAHKSEVTGDITERMTLSLSGILNSKVIKLLISGQEKLDVYQKAKLNNKVSEMPVSAVLQQDDVTVEVYWAP